MATTTLTDDEMQIAKQVSSDVMDVLQSVPGGIISNVLSTQVAALALQNADNEAEAMVLAGEFMDIVRKLIKANYEMERSMPKPRGNA